MKSFCKNICSAASLLAAGILLLAGCGNPRPQKEQMRDGTFEGIGEGCRGMIKLAIDVKDQVIESIKVISQSESIFAQESIDEMIAVILKKQTADVDAISGATLTTAGVIAAAKMAIDEAYGRPIQRNQYADCETDIVIIGGGGAGLTAAIEARNHGARVIVLEKRDYLGGNTNSATAGVNAAETHLQKELGVQDSKQIFYDDTMKGGYNLNDPELVWTLVNNAPATLDWLEDMGADFSDLGIMGGSSVKRTHRPEWGLAIGPHLMKVFSNAAREKGVDIRTGNTVQDVLMSFDGAASGVKVSQVVGKDYTIKAKAVIIATGGFGANLAMVTRYRVDLAGFSTVNHKGATGDAFAWVNKFGAELCQMDKIQTHPTAEAHNSILITEAVRGNGAILIGHDSRRFVNEMTTRDVVSDAILAQDKGTAFLLFDNAVRKSLAAIDTYAKQGLILEADDLAGLALKAGLNADQLRQSVARYNDFQAAGNDEDFSRTAEQMPLPLAQPPYCMIEVKPAIHHTMGGIHIDSDTQVLREDGTPVKGLYACGEVTGGVHGGNRLGGNGVADIVVFGKIAGAKAADAVMKK